MFDLGHDGYTCNDSEWHFAIPHWLKPAYEILYHLRVKRRKSHHSGSIFKIKDYRQTSNISRTVMGLTETWLKPHNFDLFKLKHYNSFHKYREKQSGVVSPSTYKKISNLQYEMI